MLDLSRFTDAVSSFLGNSGLAGGLGDNPLASALSEAGIDPSSLAGLGLDDILATLAANGIDPTAFDPQEVQRLLASLGCEGGLDAVAHAVLNAHELR